MLNHQIQEIASLESSIARHIKKYTVLAGVHLCYSQFKNQLGPPVEEASNSMSTSDDMDTSSKASVTAVCNEENDEGQKSFIKEQVIPVVTITPIVEDQSPRQHSCTHLFWSSEKNGMMQQKT